MKVTIRAAAMGDAPALADLLRQLGYPDTAPFIERRLRELAAHPDALVLVAEGGGIVLGAISLHFIAQLARPGDFCRVNYLCVEERARSLGIGAALEAEAVAAARQRGCVRIELHSHQRRTDAHRFYARLGYVESPKYLMKDVSTR